MDVDYKIADQLIVRTREIVWMDWNPTNEFWYTEMQNRRDDIDFITLTYLDNEALDKTTVKEIESHKDRKAWWQVYGLGQLGAVEGKIYSNWQIIDAIPHEPGWSAMGWILAIRTIQARLWLFTSTTADTSLTRFSTKRG
jgi:phage terminase large subunit